MLFAKLMISNITFEQILQIHKFEKYNTFSSFFFVNKAFTCLMHYFMIWCMISFSVIIHCDIQNIHTTNIKNNSKV